MFSDSQAKKNYFLDPKRIFQQFSEQFSQFYKFTNSFVIINHIINLLCSKNNQ